MENGSSKHKFLEKFTTMSFTRYLPKEFFGGGCFQNQHVVAAGWGTMLWCEEV